MHWKELCTLLKIKSLAVINMPIHKQNSQFNIFKDDVKVKNFTSMVTHIEGHYQYKPHL